MAAAPAPDVVLAQGFSFTASLSHAGSGIKIRESCRPNPTENGGSKLRVRHASCRQGGDHGTESRGLDGAGRYYYHALSRHHPLFVPCMSERKLGCVFPTRKKHLYGLIWCAFFLRIIRHVSTKVLFGYSQIRIIPHICYYSGT